MSGVSKTNNPTLHYSNVNMENSEKNKQKQLAEQYRAEIAHQYDPETVRKTERFFNFIVRNFFISEIKVTGISNLRGVDEDTPVILSSVHKSHLDYVVLGLALVQNAFSCLPATIAGKNLFHGHFEKLLPQLKGICLDRERVDPKNLRSKENLLYLSTFYDYLTKEVIYNEAVTIYPEGGRSYSGKLLPLNLGIFGIAKRVLKETGGRVAIVPVGITYDRVTEDSRFMGLLKCKKRSDRAYRKYDKRGFIHHALLQPKGAVYIDLGEPLYLDNVKQMDVLESELRIKMGELIRVTPVSLVCRALENKKTAKLEDVLRHIRQDLKYVKEHKLLIGRGIRYRTAGRIFARSLEHLANIVRFRDIIRISKKSGKHVIKVRREDVVNYYVNCVEHLFK